MNFEESEYPINVHDRNGNCIYTEYADGSWTRRWFHEDSTRVPKVARIQFGGKQ